MKRFTGHAEPWGPFVGLTITTADERLEKIFEPGAPPLARRIEALGVIRAAGIPTFVMGE